MPIYEYRCNDCGKVSTFLILSMGKAFEPTCRCGGKNLMRLMSRFATVRSEEDRLDSLADPGKWGDIDENDPKSAAHALKRMGKEIGEEAGEDFDEMVDEIEAGGLEEGPDEEGGGSGDLDDF